MNSCKKSVDSTFYIFIYNVPKDKNKYISKLLKKLETESNLVVDVEMNSLDDAYVKILQFQTNKIRDMYTINNIETF